MPSHLIKSVGRDMERPETFYWNIKSADQENVIVSRGFRSIQAAQADLEATIKALVGGSCIVNE